MITLDRVLAAFGLIRAARLSSTLGDTSKRLERIAREALEDSHELRKRLALETRRAEHESEHAKNARAYGAKSEREAARLRAQIAEEKAAYARLLACNAQLGPAATKNAERSLHFAKALDSISKLPITQSHNIIAREMAEIARAALKEEPKE